MSHGGFKSGIFHSLNFSHKSFFRKFEVLGTKPYNNLESTQKYLFPSVLKKIVQLNLLNRSFGCSLVV